MILIRRYRDGRYGFFYSGASTTLNFANGSTNTYQTMARIPGNSITGVTDGESAFQKICTKPTVAVAPAAASPTTAPFRPGNATSNNFRLKGYPIAQVSSSYGQISGYYFQSAANKDVGVISMNSFEPNTPAEFQAVFQTMLAEMNRDGKTKLVIDLQGNGGGIILNGYGAFRQLFPKTQDFSLARQQINPVYSTLTSLTSEKIVNFNMKALNNGDDIGAAESHFNQEFDINQNRSKFTSCSDKFVPVSVNGDKMSNMQQWDFSDRTLTINETTGAGMDVTATGHERISRSLFLLRTYLWYLHLLLLLSLYHDQY